MNYEKPAWRKAPNAIALVVLLLGPLVSRTACGNSVNPLQEGLEALMDAQGANASLVGRAFGPDGNSALSFTGNVDVLGNSFAYALNPGLTYQGQPITSNGSGTLDAVTGLWTFLSSGSVGGATWSGTGSGSFTGDPSFIFRWDWTIVEAGTQAFFDYLSIGTLVVVNGGPESDAAVTYTILGLPVAVVASHDLIFEPDWSWDLGGNAQIGINVVSQGSEPVGGGPGFFTTEVLATPEPLPLTMFGSGTVVLLVLFRWRQSRCSQYPQSRRLLDATHFVTSMFE